MVKVKIYKRLGIISEISVGILGFLLYLNLFNRIANRNLTWGFDMAKRKVSLCSNMQGMSDDSSV